MSLGSTSPSASARSAGVMRVARVLPVEQTLQSVVDGGG